MSDPVIVSAARTAIGTARKGSLINTTPEELATFPSQLHRFVHGLSACLPTSSAAVGGAQNSPEKDR